MTARALDTATLSFGLVTIPVKIYTTSEPSQEIDFHLVHAGCGERLRQRYVCPAHGEAPIVDLMAALEASLGGEPAKQHGGRAKRAERHAPARKHRASRTRRTARARRPVANRRRVTRLVERPPMGARLDV